METRAQRRKSAAAAAVQPDFKVNGNGNGNTNGKAVLSKVSHDVSLCLVEENKLIDRVA